MQNTLIIFGGRSAEHEISIRSARNIIAALDKKLFKPILVVISRTGSWHLLNIEAIPDNMKEASDLLPGSSLCSLMRRSDETVIITENGKAVKIDVAFPVLHGPMGEDGTIQGLFEMMILPYVGAGVLSSAMGMDKDIMNQRFIENGIATAPFLTLKAGDTIPKFKDICSSLDSEILFVKPAVMGSAVGVSKTKNEAEFVDAVNQAFKYSSKILVEKAISGRELECSVLGNRDPEASCVGEIKPNHEFYNYEAKYLDPNGADIIIPAKNVSDEVVDSIRELSIKAFKAIECCGMARVDFFYSDEGKIYVNELNTLPGFTSISMYPKLWEASGVSYTELITKLLKLALEEFEFKKTISLVPVELSEKA